jgi:hypothetical protein
MKCKTNTGIISRNGLQRDDGEKAKKRMTAFMEEGKSSSKEVVAKYLKKKEIYDYS